MRVYPGQRLRCDQRLFPARDHHVSLGLGVERPADHPEARVSRDNVQAKTGETNRELAGPTCAVQDAGVGRKGLHEVAGCRD